VASCKFAQCQRCALSSSDRADTHAEETRKGKGVAARRLRHAATCCAAIRVVDSHVSVSSTNVMGVPFVKRHATCCSTARSAHRLSGHVNSRSTP
jgi:hypothetical protein